MFKLGRFGCDEKGATLVEYGVALIVAIVVGGVALTNLGADTSASINLACSELQPSAGGAASVNWQNSTSC